MTSRSNGDTTARRVAGAAEPGAGRGADRESKTVVLYNPRSVFFTMPLALLAVASALDRRRWRPRIVDARLEDAPHETLLGLLDDAVAVGLTVLTGDPLRDALAASRAVKAVRPDLRVVWGGWHPSLFPTETLAEPAVDVTVQGQGEVTFARLVDRLGGVDGHRPPGGGGRADLAGLEGLAYRGSDGPARNPPRPLTPMDQLPESDYGLIDVERYFALKGRRQLDYVSSVGCPFRCAFCADPFVFGRKWAAISPPRVGEELEGLWQRYRFTELAFQDETFFTYRDRVAEIAQELLSRGVDVRWTATLRADQAERLGDDVLDLCVRSGMDRVMIGVESGSQEMLDWMLKDITVEQVIDAAERCARRGVGATFPFIVGLPDESDESVEATLSLVKRLRAMSPRFETPIFYFKPYPGSLITDQVVRQGHRLPDSVEAWADFDFIGSSGPWVSAAKRRRIERFKFYSRFAWGPESWARWPLQRLARLRCRYDRYDLPWEKALVERLRPSPRLS